ncbi:hypothetical protein DICPUDRAFT_85648 [Dictyostelium purpureum]|uniref:Uncharacterized protein n=1 Tax=Dictyostelium purpureum TaxID=5786 RepID=F1A6E8_DICPU|nr:uncharacterized protein DICPUDRAFT_85648 [Dictyostelium purpureum]EGC28232.1 hypothetical protein DICPUDRAFT_85648 [Dictyostelium purpureum]|eukprot:XP_003295241.1 hypothetical protein DICPUDRAFT_85648 [Dictyostelium purpureum]
MTFIQVKWSWIIRSPINNIKIPKDENGIPFLSITFYARLLSRIECTLLMGSEAERLHYNYDFTGPYTETIYLPKKHYDPKKITSTLSGDIMIYNIPFANSAPLDTNPLSISLRKSPKKTKEVSESEKSESEEFFDSEKEGSKASASQTLKKIKFQSTFNELVVFGDQSPADIEICQIYFQNMQTKKK